MNKSTSEVNFYEPAIHHSEKLIEELKMIKENATPFIQQELSQKISNFKKGIQGESDIKHALQYSNLDLVVLYDLYLTIGDYAAQIDFIVITDKIIYIIESKFRNGVISFDENGQCLQEFNGKITPQKSPYTQNEEHKVVLEKILNYSYMKNNSPLKFSASFAKRVKSLVIFSNPEMKLDLKETPEDIRSRISRSDNLIRKIKAELEICPFKKISYQKKVKIADYLVSFNFADRPNYKESILQEIMNKDKNRKRKLLQNYRSELLKNGEKEKYIFSEESIGLLLEKQPQNMTELRKIYGWGAYNCQNYGEDILEILAS